MTAWAPSRTPLLGRSLLRAAMVLLLLSVTALERFGVSAGQGSTSIALVAIYVFLAVAAFTSGLELSRERLLLYAGCIAVALASLLFNERGTSPSSLALIVAMYLPFVFVLRPGSLGTGDDGGWVRARFADVALFCAFAGIIQFAVQPFIHADWLFDYTRYIPENLRAGGVFNTVIPVGSFNKSNGFFFREPSSFSYVMGLGLLVECTSAKRRFRIACLALALLLTYSGTGILALLLGSLYPLGPKTVLRLGLVACVGGAVFFLLGDVLDLSFTLGRLSEFNSSYSSAYMRYIAPARLVSENFDSSSWAPWFGHGPGMIFRLARDYESHDPTWAKLLFEYGVLGFIGFVTLFAWTLRRPAVPVQVRAALFWGWLIMGGNLLSSELNFMTLALVGLCPPLDKVITIGARRRRAEPQASPLTGTDASLSPT